MIVQTESTPDFFITPSLQEEQRMAAVYLKPLVLATLAALLLSFLVAYVSMSLTARFSNSSMKPENASSLVPVHDSTKVLTLPLNKMVY